MVEFVDCGKSHDLWEIAILGGSKARYKFGRAKAVTLLLFNLIFLNDRFSSFYVLVRVSSVVNDPLGPFSF
jgi:hypothetical protein